MPCLCTLCCHACNSWLFKAKHITEYQVEPARLLHRSLAAVQGTYRYACAVHVVAWHLQVRFEEAAEDVEDGPTLELLGIYNS
jgi:formate hydrogenlyase subunit 4